jgi:hypothetical protein
MPRFSALHRKTAAVSSATFTYDTAIGNGVDSSGYALLPLNTGAKRFYVNNSTGSDTNTSTQAQSASTPVATISKALSYVTQSAGDQILVAEGTTGYAFVNVSGKDGASPTYPTVIQTYNPSDPTNTALFGKASGSNRPTVTSFPAVYVVGGSGASPKYIAVRGFNFNFGNIADQGVANLANTTGTPDYLLYENCIFSYCSLNFDLHTAAGGVRTKHIVVRNCAQYGSFGNSLSDHQQGIYADLVDGLTVEDCIFWRSGWKTTATRATAAASGGPTQFNHPLYIQTTCLNTMVRRNCFIDCSSDGSVIKGGGIYQGNLSLNNPIGVGMGGGNNTSTDLPLGAYIDVSYNIIIGGGIVSTADGGSAQDWGIDPTNGMLGSQVHHNVIARSSAQAANTFFQDTSSDVFSVSMPNYTDFHDNISYLWSASGSTKSTPSVSGNNHCTFSNNLWDDPTSGTNTSNSGHSFANSYTADGLAVALGYANLAALKDAAIADPQRQWRNAVSLAQTGYGITIPSLVDLKTNFAVTIGIATTGQFIGAQDGSTISQSGLPSSITINSDNRSWAYDGTGTTSSGSATITETNGANSHNTVISWSLSPQPVLSSLTITSTTSATVSTNTGNGTLYWMTSASSTAPDWPHIRAGYNMDNSTAALSHGSQAISATGTQTITGITAMSVGQWLYVAQLDSGNNPSSTSSAQK